MAPEIVKKDWKPQTTKVDIWALGVLVHKILTDKSPFLGNTKDAIFANIFNQGLNITGLKNRKVDVKERLDKLKDGGVLARDFIT